VVSTGNEDALTDEFPLYMREPIFRWMHDELDVDNGWLKADTFVDFKMPCVPTSDSGGTATFSGTRLHFPTFGS